MKKIIAIIAVLIAAVCCFAGCSGGSDDNGMQAAYDTSVEAKKYADGLFADLMAEKGISDYQIVSTAGGFLLDETENYYVSYTFSYDEGEEQVTDIYGYNLEKTQSGFAVASEGAEVGEFINEYTSEE